MDQNSPIEMIHLAIEYFLIGVFLVMVTYALSIRNNLADGRNQQIAREKNIKQYREFNSYNLGECDGTSCTNHIYGDQVIELIRRYYDDPEFEIFINKTNASGEEFIVNITNTSLYPELYTLAYLQRLFSSSSEFHPYLVFNGISPASVTQYQVGELGTVTGIALYWKKDN